MTWLRSRFAWPALALSLWGLLRGLRGMLPPDERPTALWIAIGIIVVTALLPVALRRAELTREQAGMRKAAQTLVAAGVTLAGVFFGLALVVAGVLAVLAALAVAALWPPPEPPR